MGPNAQSDALTINSTRRVYCAHGKCPNLTQPVAPRQPCNPMSTHRRVSILVDIVPDVDEVHMPLDHLEVSGGSVAPLEHNAERIAPTGPFHGNQLGN